VRQNDSATASSRLGPADDSGDCGHDLGDIARRLTVHCAAYKGADTKRALIQLLDTAAPFMAFAIALILAIQHSIGLTLLLAVPTAGFLIRLFIIQHDCGHGSFFHSRAANDLTGRLISILTLTPYGHWRRSHAEHHASSGNLGRRGVGDINTLTIREYLDLPAGGRLRYRLYRNPFILIIIGAPIYFLLLQRFPFGAQLPFRQILSSIGSLDLAIAALYGTLFAFVGVQPVLMAFLPVAFIASWAAGWLFYVQHQFEDAYWEDSEDWDFHLAGLTGSSHYALPRVLQWFTGNIGLHHIHHLCSRIPNYRLQECLDASPELQQLGPRLTLLGSFKCVRLALWDEDERKLVGFGHLRRPGPQAQPA